GWRRRTRFGRRVAPILAPAPQRSKRTPQMLVGNYVERFGAEAGTRTPTPLRALDPESSASANSATSARRYSTPGVTAPRAGTRDEARIPAALKFATRTPTAPCGVRTSREATTVEVSPEIWLVAGAAIRAAFSAARTGVSR